MSNTVLPSVKKTFATVEGRNYASKEIGVIQASFSYDQFKPVYVTATEKGLKAEELLRSPDFRTSKIVTGGIYFKLDEDNKKRYLPDGLVYSGLDGKGILSPSASFSGGGYLLVANDGSARIIRAKNFSMYEDGITTYLCDETRIGEFFYDFEEQNSCSPENFSKSCAYIDQFTTVVQSNVILVSEGMEDRNGNKVKHICAALTVNNDGTMSVFATDDETGLKDFGNILVNAGVKYAINLDGGPSVQIAERQNDGSIKNWVDWEGVTAPSYDKGEEDKSEAPNRMPILFVVNSQN